MPGERLLGSHREEVLPCAVGEEVCKLRPFGALTLSVITYHDTDVGKGMCRCCSAARFDAGARTVSDGDRELRRILASAVNVRT